MTTSDLQEAPDQRQGTGKSKPSVETFGLENRLAELALWATQQGLEEPLLLLLDASKCHEHPVYTGTVLAFLRQPVPIACLTLWADENPFIEKLHSLGQACMVSPLISRQFPHMPTTQAVAKQFHGGLLSELPLIALVARPVQCTTTEAQTWIEALRAWAVIQLLDITFFGRTTNQYLLTVVNKLRQAIDGDQDWLSVFEQLQGPTNSLHAIRRHLRSKCEAILANKPPGLRPIEQQMLSQLLAYCNGRGPNTDEQETRSFGPFARFQQFHSKSRSLKPLELPIDETTDAQPLAIIETNGDGPESQDSGPLIEVITDVSDSPSTQIRKATGVLLSSIEDNQFLPWTWNRPNEFERVVLDNWIERCLTVPDHPDQNLALLCWVAIQTSHSLRTVLGIELSSESSDDWRLDPERGLLHRQPPRRYNSWRANDACKAWVVPRVDRLQVQPALPAQHLIKKLHQSGPTDAKTLADWFSSQPSAESRFLEVCQSKPGLERLTSGMLTRTLAQKVYAQTTDSNLSLLLSSHPRTGLPGSCAYSAYRHDVTMQALQIHRVGVGHHEEPSAPLNAAGSELDPMESLLRTECSEVLKKVNLLSTDPARWIEHHNALTAYCVVSLLAATGGRPVTSPFESLSIFDFQRRLCFLEDKSVSAQHEGRLLPLPAGVLTLVQDRYLPHLARLARIVEPVDAKLSQAIVHASEGKAHNLLPLFFFLSGDPELGWAEVSEKSLSALELFKWPLPWNLMRHRLASNLRRMGVDHEIINGLFDHSEQGTAAYGPYSSRTQLLDMQACQPTLELLYDKLNLKLPEVAHWPLEAAAPVRSPSSGTALQSSLRFGSDARRDRRLTQHAHARDQALDEIEQFLNKRPPDSLSVDQWEQLGQSMLLTPTGMPHPMASLRYETFSTWLQKQWDDKGVLPKLRKRYLPTLEEPTPFTRHAVGAHERLQRARDELKKLRSWPDSKITKRNARLLCCLSLILECRISDKEVIWDVATGRNFKLVRFAGHHYLEHAPHLDRWPDAPVRRYWLAEQTLHWLTLPKSSQHLDITKLKPDQRFEALIKAADLPNAPLTSKQLINTLSAIVQQCNAMDFPSQVAAYLNGKLITAALGHADWIRVHIGIAPQMQAAATRVAVTDADGQEKNTLEDDLDILNGEEVFDTSSEASLTALNTAQFLEQAKTSDLSETSSPVSVPAHDERQRAQHAAHEFFANIRKAIREQSAKRSSPRRDLDAQLRKIIGEAKDVSVSCRLLAEWTRSLLWRRGHNGQLRLSSIERYLTALSPCFEAEAHDHNLTDCDSEDLTDFYGRILEARRLITPHRESSAPDSSDKSGHSTDDSYRTWQLAANLLKNFHHTLSSRLSLEDPDWSEFIGDEAPLSISPGLLLEQDYLHCLHVLTGDPQTTSHIHLAHGFALLLCMRFGLRGHEVDGLMRNDLIETEDGSIVVLVRSNRLRSLKTPAGRRQIPLIFELTETEQVIYQRFLAGWSGISADNQDIPLFADPVHPRQRLDGRRLRQRISGVIKLVTRNSALSLHHARHTFANRVAHCLLDDTDDLWPFLANDAKQDVRREHVRKLLLCTTQTTRRSMWALARLLGHAHPHTTVRSYLHMLPDLAARLVRARADTTTQTRATHPGVHDLDTVAYHPDYLRNEPENSVLVPPPITAQNILRFLRRYHTSGSTSNALYATELPSSLSAAVIRGIEFVDDRLATRHSINPHVEGRSRLLGHITPSRWEHWDSVMAQQGTHLTPTQDEWLQIGKRLNQVGASRQLLLFEEEHFTRFKAFTQRWDLSDTDMQLAYPPRLHPDVAAWAAATGFEPVSLETLTELGQKVQLDTVTIGHPPNPVRHRCAVLARTSAGSAFKSRFEFLLLYLIDSLLTEQHVLSSD